MSWVESWSLVSLWWAIVLGGLAVILLIVGFALHRRRATSDGRRSWIGIVAIGLFFAMLAVGAGVNSAQGWYLTVGDVIADPGPSAPEITMGESFPGDTALGVHINAEIPGGGSGIGTKPADIWLPPQYFSEPSKSFPVVYLFPGTPGTSDDWFDLAQAAQTALNAANHQHPVILVAPTAAPKNVDSECVNGSAGNWETYLTQEVPKYVGSNFRVLKGPDHTAAAGLSMGGYCAQMLALRHPDIYSVGGNFSGTTIADFEGGLAALFGPVADLQREINEHDSAWLIAHRPAARGVPMWLEVGDRDSSALIADQQDYCSYATTLGTDTVCQTLPGGHTSQVWAQSFDSWLDWALPKIS